MHEFDYEIDKSVLLSKSNFSAYIEKMVLEQPGLTYFEAIIKFSEESDKEAEELMKYMTDVLLDKVKQSAIDMELIRSETYSLDDLL